MGDLVVTGPAFGLNRDDWSTPRAFAADVARAEALGWDWAFLPVDPLAIWDPYVMLALAATTTTRIGLGTLLENAVLENAVLDNPAPIDNGIASVACAAAGSRTLLGLGIGDGRRRRHVPWSVHRFVGLLD